MKNHPPVSASRYHKRLVGLVRGDSQSWIPLSVFQPVLWINRIVDNNFWPAKYWVAHSNTNYLSLQTVVDGDLKIIRDGQSLTVSPGSAALIPPGSVRLATGNSGKCLKRYLIFSGHLISGLYHELKLDRVSVLPDFANSEFTQLFGRAFALCSRQTPEDARELSSVAFSILLYVMSKLGKNSIPHELLVCKAFIEENIGLAFSLDSLAQASSCSKSKLKWQFKKHFHTSPGKYITEMRMRYALRLLEDSNLLLKQVAMLCGYDNPLYFSTAFRAYYNCSPRECRKMGLPQGHAVIKTDNPK